MPLELTGTWEQAVLVAAVKAAAEAPAGGCLGRTALQKAMYFVHTAGVPMRYKFDLYHYGPYCDRITRDVELLVADGVVRDASANREVYSSYEPDSAAGELLSLHSDRLSQYLSRIEAVVRTLLPFQVDHLELMATLDYLFRQLKAGGGQGPWRDRVIQRFMEVKKDKFTSAKVAEAYNSMARVGLIEG